MAWWLAYEELYGDMDKTYPIKGVSMSDVNLDDTGHSDYWYDYTCLLYTSPSPRDGLLSRMPSSA